MGKRKKSGYYIRAPLSVRIDQIPSPCSQKSLENMSKYKHLGMTLTFFNNMRGILRARWIMTMLLAIWSRIRILSSHLQLQNMITKMYRTVILPFVLYGRVAWSVTLRGGWGCLRIGCWRGYNYLA